MCTSQTNGENAAGQVFYEDGMQIIITNCL